MLGLACQALWDPPAQTQWVACASGHLILLGPRPGAMDKVSKWRKGSVKELSVTVRHTQVTNTESPEGLSVVGGRVSQR